MDILQGLNPQQRQAVSAGPGPVLVLAGPGSGKTRVLAHRVAYLVGHLGVPAYRIMAVTFTNKAAREMRHRVEGLLGGNLHGLTIGTFHSICARLLRRESAHLPTTGDFVIYDEADQQALAKQALKELNIDEKQFRPSAVLGAISKAKNELIGPEEFVSSTYFAEVAGRVYRRYQELLVQNNAMDFDDLLMGVVVLFEQHPEVLGKYQRQYEHILVDEFQDTNTAQYALLRQLAAVNRNLYCVGDPDQCFPAGTSVQTPSGPRAIESIRPEEAVIAASGRGASMPAEVRHVECRAYDGELVRVATRSGLTFRVTPNHIVFARLGVNPGVHYVYLMHRKDLGYRVGVAAGARSDGESPDLQVGLKVRSNQEVADRIWVLRVCPDRDDACYWEAYYAFEYGIPTTVFHTRGRRMRFSQALIKRLYRSIDTRERAERLLGDLGMDPRFPHYIPKAKFRHVVNLRYFGDQRRYARNPWNAHRVSIISGDPELRHRLEDRGYHTRKGRRNTWRTEFSRLYSDDALTLARELSRVGEGMEVVTGAFLLEPPNGLPARRFGLMPASHLHPTMIVAIECDGRIVPDDIVEVGREQYRGPVYDLEVAELHNYIAGGIVVHNSVYRWRGADYRNVRRFQDDYPDALTILLEQNYRSTQIILDAATAVIDKNPNRTRKALFTERDGGIKAFAYEAYDEHEEGQFVVDTIASLVREGEAEPGDCAVMYRTNAQSRAIEEAFLRANLPYKLVGAQRFYGRREVKDLLSYLRLVHNPADSVSLMRVLNVPPRGIGGKTVEQLQAVASAAGVAPGQVLLDLAEAGKRSAFASEFAGRAGAALAGFGQLLAGWLAVKAECNLVMLIDRILDDTGYRDYIVEGSSEDDDRWSNVLELRKVASEFDAVDLATFLEEIALVSDQDTLNEQVPAPTLLTLHAAKGLEFPVVFIVGLDEGVLPHQRSFDDPEEMAEERRLMYVGLTRAKDRLYLLRAFRRTMWGDSGVTNPSRFLEDIPVDLMEGKLARRQTNAEAMFLRATAWESRSASAARTVETEFRSGMRVKHSLFGEGIVVESRLTGGEEEVTVVFDEVGIKRLVAGMAKLKILKG